jgi:hypothetical protein
MAVVAEYNLFMNSYYRTKGTNANPTFTLREPIILKDPNHYFTAKIMATDIPYSFNTINTGNNILNVSASYHGGATVAGTITITPGNYSITNLLDELDNKLNLFCKTIQPNHAPLFPSTYDRDTGKVTLQIEHTSGQDWTVNILWYDGISDLLAPFFGFDPSLNPPNFTTTLYVDNTNIPVYTNNVSLYNVNCSPVTSLYLRSTSLQQEANNVEFLVSADDSVSDILLKIPVSTFPGSWIIYENGLDFQVRLRVKNIDQVDFYLTDGQSYEPLLLNNVHWKLHLLIQEVKPDWYDQYQKIDSERQQKIKELEELKQSLIDDLRGTADELKEGVEGDLPLQEDTTQPTTTPDTEQTDTTTPEVLKAEFLRQIQQNRQSQINDSFNADFV